MKSVKLFNVFFALLIVFLLSSCGEKKSEEVQDETSKMSPMEEVTPAKDSDRLVSYFKKAVEWAESDEFKDLEKKNPMGIFEKLVDIAKDAGYEGEDNKAINQQLEKDYEAFKSDPEVREWHDKLQTVFK